MMHFYSHLPVVMIVYIHVNMLTCPHSKKRTKQSQEVFQESREDVSNVKVWTDIGINVHMFG